VEVREAYSLLTSYDEAKWIGNTLFKSFVNAVNIQIAEESSIENILGEIDYEKSS